MSRRPIEAKKRRRIAKLFRSTPIAYIDLVAWLRQFPGVNTAGDARWLILSGCVRHESHTLGREDISRTLDGRLTGNPCVPSHLREGLYVSVPHD